MSGIKVQMKTSEAVGGPNSKGEGDKGGKWDGKA